MSNDATKFLALAALGVAAYVFIAKRPAQVSSPAQLPAAQGVTTPDRSGLYNLAGGLIGRLIGQAGATGSGSTWQTGGSANNPSAYLASSALDGVAYNPPANSPFEAAYISAVGMPSFEVDPGWTFFQ